MPFGFKAPKLPFGGKDEARGRAAAAKTTRRWAALGVGPLECGSARRARFASRGQVGHERPVRLRPAREQWQGPAEAPRQGS